MPEKAVWVVIAKSVREGRMVTLEVKDTREAAEQFHTKALYSSKYKAHEWTQFQTLGPANESDPAARKGYRFPIFPKA